MLRICRNKLRTKLENTSLSPQLFLECTEFTLLYAETAAVAHRIIHMHGAVRVFRERGAAGPQAHAALFALVGNLPNDVRELLAFEQCARRADNDDGQRISGGLLTDHAFQFFGIKGAHFDDMLDVHGFADLVDRDCRHFLSGERLAGRGVILMAGHARRGIVEDHDCSGPLIVGHVLQRIDTGVHEGGIADHSDPVLDVLPAPALFHTVER